MFLIDSLVMMLVVQIQTLVIQIMMLKIDSLMRLTQSQLFHILQLQIQLIK